MAKGGAKILFGLFFFVVLVAVLAGGGAWYLTEHRVEGFRSTALLRLDPGEGLQSAENDGDSIGVSTSSLPAPDYAVLFEADSIAKQLQEALAANSELPPMSLEEIREAMDAETTVAIQTANHVVYQQIVQLHFTAPTPAMAQAAAQAWADLCVKDDIARSAEVETAQREALLAELETATAELNGLRLEQTELRKLAPIASLEMAVDTTNGAVAELRRAVRTAQAAAARGEAALNALKAYVSKAPPAVVLELSMTAATAEAETAGAQAESTFLAGQVAEAEAAAAAANTAWVEAVQKHEDLEERIERIAPEVASLERQLAAIQGQGARVRLAAPAVAPEAPVGPHRYVIVAGAAILGAIAGMVVYFGLLTLRVYARELDRT